MKHKVFIQIGKFQTPNTAFHKGHLAVTEAILQRMKPGDILYITVAKRINTLLFDPQTTIQIIKQILRPLFAKTNNKIIVDLLDTNFLFGLYNIPKKLSTLYNTDIDAFLKAYNKRIDTFIAELSESASINFNNYDIVLVTGKEDTRGLLYEKLDGLYNLHRNFDTGSTSKTQYLNIDLVLDGANKISSSDIRKSNKILYCADIWGTSINKTECTNIDNNINKIIHKIKEQFINIKTILNYNRRY